MDRTEQMSRLVVIAKYQENLSWTSQLTSEFIYYDKSDRMFNVGREAHTYCHHIIKNYETLSDELFFTQGDPFDHCPDFINVTQQPLIEDFVALGGGKFGQILQCDQTGAPNHRGLDLKVVWDKLFTTTCPTSFSFSSGATLAVKKSRILFRPKEFYIKCRDILAYDINPIEGFVFERLWSRIFDGSTT